MLQALFRKTKLIKKSLLLFVREQINQLELLQTLLLIFAKPCISWPHYELLLSMSPHIYHSARNLFALLINWLVT